MKPKSNLVFQMLLFSLLILTFSIMSNAQIFGRKKKGVSITIPHLSSQNSATGAKAVDLDESFLTPWKNYAGPNVWWNLKFEADVQEVLRSCPSIALKLFEETTRQSKEELVNPMTQLVSALKSSLQKLNMKPDVYHSIDQLVNQWVDEANQKIKSEADYFTALVLLPFFSHPKTAPPKNVDAYYSNTLISNTYFEAQLQPQYVSFHLLLDSIRKPFSKLNPSHQEQVDKLLSKFHRKFHIAPIHYASIN